MFEVYLLITLIIFIINGIAYNISLTYTNIEPTFGSIIRSAIIYLIMSLLWPIQIIYLAKLSYEEFKNGKSN